MMTDDLVVDPVFKMRSRFWATEDDVLHVESWVDPGGGVTPHVHPGMEERFEVIEGTPEFLAGRRWTAYEPGSTAVVPPGTRHAFRNRGDDVAHFVCHVTPPSTLEEFLTDAAAMSRAGLLTKRAFPTSLDAVLQAAVLAERHRDMVTLLAPLPPKPVQRLVMPALARVGARRGHVAGRLGDRSATMAAST